VNISVFDVVGNKIIDAVNEKQNAGDQSVALNTSGLANGIYFIQVFFDDVTLTQ
jgi:hypothetical protein